MDVIAYEGEVPPQVINAEAEDMHSYFIVKEVVG